MAVSGARKPAPLFEEKLDGHSADVVIFAHRLDWMVSEMSQTVQGFMPCVPGFLINSLVQCFHHG